MKCKKQPALVCPIGVILEQVLARWRRLVACHEPLPTGDVRGILPPHRNDHRNGHQVGTYYIFVLFAVAHKERVVTRWQHPVASGVALDMLHRAMPHVLLQRLHMAIQMACRGGAFVRLCRLFGRGSSPRFAKIANALFDPKKCSDMFNSLT